MAGDWTSSDQPRALPEGGHHSSQRLSALRTSRWASCPGERHHSSDEADVLFLDCGLFICTSTVDVSSWNRHREDSAGPGCGQPAGLQLSKGECCFHLQVWTCSAWQFWWPSVCCRWCPAPSWTNTSGKVPDSSERCSIMPETTSRASSSWMRSTPSVSSAALTVKDYNNTQTAAVCKSTK